jgi:hypothetical protein
VVSVLFAEFAQLAKFAEFTEFAQFAALAANQSQNQKTKQTCPRIRNLLVGTVRHIRSRRDWPRMVLYPCRPNPLSKSKIFDSYLSRGLGLEGRGEKGLADHPPVNPFLPARKSCFIVLILIWTPGSGWEQGLEGICRQCGCNSCFPIQNPLSKSCPRFWIEICSNSKDCSSFLNQLL